MEEAPLPSWVYLLVGIVLMPDQVIGLLQVL